jgi:curved DNA-binding protein CbpA
MAMSEAIEEGEPPSIEGLSLAEMDDIDQMYTRISDTYYDLLGLGSNCTRPEVRTAYQELVRQYHPEAFWNRDLGVYRMKVEAISRAVTTAFEVLCDTRRRAEYDETLKALKTTTPSKVEAPSAAPLDVRSPLVPRTETFVGPKSPPRSVVTPPKASQIASPRVLQSVTPEEPQSEPHISTESVPKEITFQSLRRSHAEHQLKQRHEHVNELLERARQAEVRNERGEVLSLLRQAATLLPDNEEIKRHLADVEAQTSLSTFERACNAARLYEKDKRWDLATELWVKACAERPKDLAAHLGVVRASCEGLVDMPRAADYARRATQIDAHNAEAFALMARVFFLAGRMASARGAVESALKIDPAHEQALELARKIKKR